MNLPIFSIACSSIWRVDESNVDGFAVEVFFIFDAVLAICFSRKWRAIYPRRVGVVTGVNFDELAAAFGTDRDSAGVIGLDMAAVCFFYDFFQFFQSDAGMETTDGVNRNLLQQGFRH